MKPRFFAGAIIALAVLSNASAQEQALPPGSSPPGPPPTVAANYTIQARVIVDSSLIRGNWELEYQNRTNEELHELYLNLPRWKESKGGERKSLVCSLDSLLVNGTPAAVMVTDEDCSAARIPLEYPLKPLEKVFLLAAFTTRFSPNMMSTSASDPPTVYSAWHPSVAVFSKGKWYAGKKVKKDGWRGELGHFNVALTVDSGFELVGPGELINEIQIYGLLPTPRQDTVILDFTRARQKAMLQVSPPTFISGEKTYSWRFRSVRVFAFALGRNLVCDRAYLGVFVASLWYDRQTASAFGDSSALLTSKIASLEAAGTMVYQQPNTQVAVVVGQMHGPSVRTEGLVVIAVDPKKGTLDHAKTLQTVLHSLMLQKE